MDIKGNKTIKKIVFSSLILFFILIGIYLRFYRLETQPYWMDEGYTVLGILAIAEKGVSVLDSGQAYFCPLYCYPSAWAGKIFGFNAFSYRFFAAVWGVVLLGFVYYFAQKLFNSRVGLLALFFTTFSYYQIAWSRQARWYTLFSLFFLLALFFFFKYCSQKKKKNLSLALVVVFTALAVLTHKIAYLLPFAFAVWLAVDYIFFKKHNLAKFIILICLGVGLFAVDYIFNFHFFSVLAHKTRWHYSLPFYLSFYLRNYWLFIFFALVAFFEAKKEARRRVSFLAVPLITYFLAFSFLTNIIHYRYLFHLTPIFYILGAVGIEQTLQKTKSRLAKTVMLGGIILIFFLTGQGVVRPQNFYFLESDDPSRLNRPYYAYTPQPNFNQAYKFIQKRLKNNEIIISSHPAFNKIFLSRPGFWLKYNYIGLDNRANLVKDDKEYYVGARVIDNLAELKKIRQQNHGYLIFDYMSADNRLPAEVVSYIRSTMKLVFFDKVNPWSQIWVYRF